MLKKLKTWLRLLRSTANRVVGKHMHLQAIESALAKAEDAILKDHAATCVESAVASGDGSDQRRKFAELIDLIGRVKR